MSETETIIYGASDDLIEIGGNVSEELYANYGEPTYFRVGDWKFKAEYDINGEWRFTVVEHPSGQMWTHLGVGESHDHRDYTEVIRFDGPIGVTVEKVDPPTDSNGEDEIMSESDNADEIDLEREKNESFEMGQISQLEDIAEDLRNRAGDIYAEADSSREIGKANQLKTLAREYEDRALEERDRWDETYG